MSPRRAHRCRWRLGPSPGLQLDQPVPLLMGPCVSTGVFWDGRACLSCSR